MNVLMNKKLIYNNILNIYSIYSNLKITKKNLFVLVSLTSITLVIQNFYLIILNILLLINYETLKLKLSNLLISIFKFVVDCKEEVIQFF